MAEAISISAKAFFCIEAYLSQGVEQKDSKKFSQGMENRFARMLDLIKATSDEKDAPVDSMPMI